MTWRWLHAALPWLGSATSAWLGEAVLYAAILLVASGSFVLVERPARVWLLRRIARLRPPPTPIPATSRI